ncbi:alpha-catulin isoform 1 [Danaus plexippus plexippus]|uniref:Alpha-catulin isoform 1 n=1 Tax=Danaus plexippus plexippus TaxID=278856 RepID=A0A212ESR6_DANPL|nr:alpha-catulin isoform 1 [Danaus plexippus plexippus]
MANRPRSRVAPAPAMAAAGMPDIEAHLSQIKTRSIEKTLLPLIKQISSLVATRGEAAAGGAAVQRVGAAVCCAVERFVAVGETIADDNPDVRHSMVLACKEARAAGRAIERVCTGADGSGMISAARALLASVTRVLLLADMVVVRQLLLAKDKVARSLDRLESVSNFAEFVRAFTEFGGGMVELARLTAERRADLRDERRRAQVAAARNVLERSTLMLLTSSKTCLRHPGSASARENRDTVFCQMRRAMDLIHYVVRDGLPGHDDQSHEASQWEAGTALGALRGLSTQVRAARARGGADGGRRRALAATLRALVERTHDFTDSAYTSHEHRQRILALAERIAYELERLVAVAVSLEEQAGSGSGAALESACTGATSAASELERALVAAARDQARDLAPLAEEARKLASDLAHIGNLQRKIASTCGERESERLHNIASQLHEQLDHIIEADCLQVCKLLRHIAMSETLQVSAKFAEINLRIYGPQVVTAARTLAAHPNSAAARENLDVFVDMWAWLLADAARLAKELLDLTDERPDKQQYSSLPRPGKHGTTSKPLKAVKLDSDEQAKIAKSGLEMKMMSSEMDAETEKWQGADENNDIVKRAKNMSSMAFAMYQFTKGEGRLNTTQDLFTQAEYFAEEANRLYKIVRQFSYQVPAGTIKKELLEHLDKVPTYVQQLQFTVKEPTVGRAATFSKVDNVIQETKHLMNVISKVVTTCFDCANKYKLDFTGLSAAGAGRGSSRDEEAAGGGGGDAKPGGSSSESAM